MSKSHMFLALAAAATLATASLASAALTIDLRVLDGSAVSPTPKAVTVTKPGDVVQLGLFATVTGANSVATDDGVQSFYGSIVSTLTGNGAATGDMSAVTLLAPFNGSLSSPGTVQNVNGQPGLDVGSADNSNSANFLFARSSSLTPGTSTTSGSTEFLVATLNWTVTSVPAGGTTVLEFLARTGTTVATWREDNANKAPINGTYAVGSPITVTTAAVVPEPAALASALPALALLTRRRRA